MLPQNKENIVAEEAKAIPFIIFNKTTNLFEISEQSLQLLN